MSEDEKDQAIEEVLHEFEFCGCGMPDDVAEFIRAGLQHIHDLQFKVWPKIVAYGDWQAEGEKLFASNGAAYFFYYWADKEGLTEHGGSVPGWLGESGIALLEKLNGILL